MAVSGLKQLLSKSIAKASSQVTSQLLNSAFTTGLVVPTGRQMLDGLAKVAGAKKRAVSITAQNQARMLLPLTAWVQHDLVLNSPQLQQLLQEAAKAAGRRLLLAPLTEQQTLSTAAGPGSTAIHAATAAAAAAASAADMAGSTSGAGDELKRAVLQFWTDCVLPTDLRHLLTIPHGSQVRVDAD